MNVLKFRTMLVLSALITAVFFGFSKEESMASNLESSNSTITELITLQDFTTHGSLTVNSNPVFEPNALSYGYRVFNWVPFSGVAPATTIYQFDPSLPGAGTLPPSSSLSSAQADGTYSKRTDPFGNMIYMCWGTPTNCIHMSGDGSGIKILKHTLEGGSPF